MFKNFQNNIYDLFWAFGYKVFFVKFRPIVRGKFNFSSGFKKFTYHEVTIRFIGREILSDKELSEYDQENK